MLTNETYCAEFEALEGEIITKARISDNGIDFYLRGRPDPVTLRPDIELYCDKDVYLLDSDYIDQACNEVVLEAEEVQEQSQTYDGSQTYSFYKIRTNESYYTIRFFGQSTGYYSEAAILFLNDD